MSGKTLQIGIPPGHSKFALFIIENGKLDVLAWFKNRKTALRAQAVFQEVGENVIRLESWNTEPKAYLRNTEFSE